jgi:hypothetical protein
MATGTSLRPYRITRLGEREKCDLLEIDRSLHRGDARWEARTLKPRAADTVVIDRDLFFKRFASKPGRPKGATKYDWPQFVAQAIKILDENGDVNRNVDPHWNQSALEIEMRRWATKNWGEPPPAESMVRLHTAKAIAEYRKIRAE